MRRDYNPSPAEIAAIVGSAVVLGGGAYVIARILLGPPRATASKIDLPPRPGNRPSPTVTPSQNVPSTVKASAKTYAPAAPQVPAEPTVVSFGDEGWATYAWYTYKGNAPEKMWIRVDLNTSILPWDQGYGAGPGDITNFWTKYRFEGYKPGSWRWTVVIGEDTPMATAVNKNQIRIYCEEGDPCYAELRGYGGNIYTRAQRRREWTDAPAAELVAREAADWIDLAYEGSA